MAISLSLFPVPPVLQAWAGVAAGRQYSGVLCAIGAATAYPVCSQPAAPRGGNWQLASHRGADAFGQQSQVALPAYYRGGLGVEPEQLSRSLRLLDRWSGDSTAVPAPRVTCFAGTS